MVPSLEGPEGFLGLRCPRGPVSGPLPTLWGSCLSREPGEGAPELQGEQKGIMVARMRARQSATSLLGAQARAGVRPEVERQRERGGERERRGGWGGRERDEDVEEAGIAKQKTDEGGSSIHLEFSQQTVCKLRHGGFGGCTQGQSQLRSFTTEQRHSENYCNDTLQADKQLVFTPTSDQRFQWNPANENCSSLAKKY